MICISYLYSSPFHKKFVKKKNKTKQEIVFLSLIICDLPAKCLRSEPKTK